MAVDPATGVDSSTPSGKVATNIPAVGEKSASSDSTIGSWNPTTPAPKMKESPVFDVDKSGGGGGNDGPGKGGGGGMERSDSGPVGGVSGHDIY